MEAILEFVFSVIVEVILWSVVAFPGAVVLWLAKGRKHSIKTVRDEHLFLSCAIGALFWAAVIFPLVALVQGL